MPTNQAPTIPFDIILPPWMLTEFHGTQLWAWFALVVLLLLAWLIVRIISKVITFALEHGKKAHIFLLETIRTIRGPAELAVGVWLFRVGDSFLPIGAGTEHFLKYAALMTSTFAVIWLLIRLTRLACDRLAYYFDVSGKSHAKAVIPLMRKVIKTAIVFLGVIFLLQNMNVDVGAMLAGLGIGGLALALASKKTVEDLFAGVTLVMDQPARVGEFCKFPGGMGTIEDIGLRSSRIRTPDRTLMTVPNSKLADMVIENIAPRDKVLLKTNIGLRYDTRPDQLRTILQEIKALFMTRPEIAEDGRVRLVGFTPTSVDLEIFAYVMTTDFQEFLVLRQDMFLGIMDIIENAGARFAAPFPPVSLNAAEVSKPDPETKKPAAG